jgi:hypothetical protein
LKESLGPMLAAYPQVPDATDNQQNGRRATTAVN